MSLVTRVGHEPGEPGMAASQEDDAITSGGIATSGGVHGGGVYVVPDDEVARAIWGHRASCRPRLPGDSGGFSNACVAM